MGAKNYRRPQTAVNYHLVDTKFADGSHEVQLSDARIQLRAYVEKTDVVDGRIVHRFPGYPAPFRNYEALALIEHPSTADDLLHVPVMPLSMFENPSPENLANRARLRPGPARIVYRAGDLDHFDIVFHDNARRVPGRASAPFAMAVRRDGRGRQLEIIRRLAQEYLVPIVKAATSVWNKPLKVPAEALPAGLAA